MDLHNLRVPSFLYTGHDSGDNNQKVSMNSRDLPFPGDAAGLDQIVNKTKSPDSFCVDLSAVVWVRQAPSPSAALAPLRLKKSARVPQPPLIVTEWEPPGVSDKVRLDQKGCTRELIFHHLPASRFQDICSFNYKNIVNRNSRPSPLGCPRFSLLAHLQFFLSAADM